MYQHHEESLKIMEKMFREREGVIALVFGGSVAKGMERPDSDLDGMVIVTDACYEELAKENRLVAAIPVFQEKEREEKMRSFYCDMQLNYGYFWLGCRPEGYMKIRVASEIVYCIYRLILQENRVLFPCNRRLEETVEGVENKPEGIVELCREFCDTLNEQVLKEIMERYHKWTSWAYPTDPSIFCSQYAADFEQWWIYPRPLIAEW